MTNQREDKNSPGPEGGTEDRSTAACVSVDSGICGFDCRIKAWKMDRRTVGLQISESECQQVQRFSDRLPQLTLSEIFAPITSNPVYLAAEQSACHSSCPIPAAVLKAAEVALGMALARDASIRFEPCNEE
jgi:hypothetical protein